MQNGVEQRKRQYTAIVSIAYSVSVVIFLAVLLYPQIKSLFEREHEEETIKVEAKRVINYSQLSAPPPIDLKKKDPEIFKVAPKVKQVKFLQPVAKKDEEVEDEFVPTMDELETAQISTVDAEGLDSVVYDIPEVVEEPVVEEIHSFVEQMPSFVGGDQALLEYLGTTIRYPEIAKEADVSGIVIVQFVVLQDGTIDEAKVIRSVFEPLDQEALRVIRSMPKWNPGMQNGRAVKVYFTIPIRFKII